jgi:predicted CopG family antitoxin
MISEDAYELLKKRKRGNESFTDVIMRLASEKGSIGSLLDLARSDDFRPTSAETAKVMRKASKEFRMNFKTRDVGQVRLPSKQTS